MAAANPAAALVGTCANTPRVVLAHNPQSVEQLAAHRADLVLSGHTHGGQINWPGLGRLLLGKKARRWAADNQEAFAAVPGIAAPARSSGRFRLYGIDHTALKTLPARALLPIGRRAP